jgi:hypothetical protein
VNPKGFYPGGTENTEGIVSRRRRKKQFFLRVSVLKNILLFCVRTKFEDTNSLSLFTRKLEYSPGIVIPAAEAVEKGGDNEINGTTLHKHRYQSLFFRIFSIK